MTCIGYDPVPPPGLALARGTIAHEEGRISDLPGAYAVGWAKRGPSGVIPTNRADLLAVVKLMVDELAALPEQHKAGPAGLDKLLADRGVRIVDTSAWQASRPPKCGRSGRRPAAHQAGHVAPSRKVGSHPILIRVRRRDVPR